MVRFSSPSLTRTGVWEQSRGATVPNCITATTGRAFFHAIVSLKNVESFMIVLRIF